MSAERVIEISLTPVPFRFPRVIGANAYAEMHGAGRNEWLVRARTNAGNEGLSNAARFFRRDDATVEGLLALLREVVLGRLTNSSSLMVTVCATPLRPCARLYGETVG